MLRRCIAAARHAFGAQAHPLKSQRTVKPETKQVLAEAFANLRSAKNARSIKLALSETAEAIANFRSLEATDPETFAVVQAEILPEVSLIYIDGMAQAQRQRSAR